jgi:hypothetical protein
MGGKELRFKSKYTSLEKDLVFFRKELFGGVVSFFGRCHMVLSEIAPPFVIYQVLLVESRGMIK